MAVRRIFFLTHIFDEKIKVAAAEETDLCLSCIQENHKIFFTEEAKVIHKRRSTLSSTFNQQFNYGYYNTYVRLKHHAFPYINYGTCLLLLITFLTILGFYAIASTLLVFYLCFIAYMNTRSQQKHAGELVISYPGFLLRCLIDSLGNLYYLIVRRI